MIFLFPDLTTLRLAITGGIVPQAVTLQPVTLSTGPGGAIALESDANDVRALATTLKTLGVKTIKSHFAEPIKLWSWLQAIPLERESTPVQLSAQAPILFELPEPNQLPVLVGEMLRLGNDRQSYRWLAPSAAEGPQTVLLRVIGPPYYTLLRALDRSLNTGTTPVRAYAERAPRLWVELGYRHPLLHLMQAPEGQFLLLHDGRVWDNIVDGPFHDIYEIVKFDLPGERTAWQEGELGGKLAVPLRLVPGNASSPPELWVLRENAVAVLDTFVRDHPEEIVRRLAFAVALSDKPDAEPTIIVRVRPSKQGPPSISFTNALGFRPYWKLPNLFLPVGTQLQPTLRRDAVRKMLADDPAQVVWLYPGENDKFTPESLPDTAFRPLDDWISYIIDHHQQPLGSWIQATEFDFASFLCTEEAEAEPKDPGPGKKERKNRDPRDGNESAGETIPAQQQRKPRSKRASADDNFAIALPEGPPNELKVRREALEKQFLVGEGGLDNPDRQALWPELAGLNTALKEQDDAAICWMNCLWEAQQPNPQWSAGWVAGEFGTTEPEPILRRIEETLREAAPAPGHVRGIVAALVWAAGSPDTSLLRTAGRDLLPAIGRYLETQEKLLGVRAIWLAAIALAKLSGSDILGPARVRDRLLERLLAEGLSSERDLPGFLRFSGLQDSDRLRKVRDRMSRIREAAQRWCAGAEIDNTRWYVDLIFAFGLARLGETTLSRHLLDTAAEAIRNTVGSKEKSSKDAPPQAPMVHQFLLNAYTYRIEQGLAGKAHGGPLPPSLTELIPKPKETDKVSSVSQPQYAIQKMLEQSSILEPQEKIDPYRMIWKGKSDQLDRDIAALPDITNAQVLARRIGELQQTTTSGPQASTEAQVRLLAQAVEIGHRVGERFTMDLIRVVPDVLRKLGATSDGDIIKRADKLLERSIFYAAHYGQSEQVQALIAIFIEMIGRRSGRQLTDTVSRIATECLRSLRKLGQRDAIHQFLGELNRILVGEKTFDELRIKQSAIWHDALRALLHLAGGFLYFGRVEAAQPILEEARRVLIGDETRKGEKLLPVNLIPLATAYVQASAAGPVEPALQRIEELLLRMEKLKLQTTIGQYVSNLHLRLIEAVVQAIVSDDFALGPAARKWLDDDEYLVRRRIHRDVRGLLAQTSL